MNRLEEIKRNWSDLGHTRLRQFSGPDIDWLIAEVERLQEENRLFDKDNIRNMNTAKGAIERLTKERDGLKKRYHSDTDQIAELTEETYKLEAENTELKEKLGVKHESEISKR